MGDSHFVTVTIVGGLEPGSLMRDHDAVAKYDGLVDLLNNYRGRNSVTLPFEEISAAVFGGLPKSAYEYDAWWTNDTNGHSQAQAWTAAGWSVDEVSRVGKYATFVRP